MPGSRVGIVAPASQCAPHELEAGLAELRAMGFEPVFDDRLLARCPYTAGDARTRAGALLDAVADPSIDGIIGLRGGYGSLHVLPLLDARAIASARKPIVGYSDLTALLVLVVQQAGLVCFHGPTVAGRLERGERGYDRDTFLRALTDAAPLGEVGAGTLRTLKAGVARGPVVGGTLSMLAATMGTPFAFAPPPGAILFLEDVNERPYRLDRLLTQLRLAGVFSRASGVVFGQLPGCDEPGGAVAGEWAIESVLGGFPGPVVAGLPSGHTTGPALTIPLGVGARLTAAGGAASLVFEEPAVERRARG